MSNAESSANGGPGGPLIALVAGEASGDQLGGALIEALRLAYPHARFVGVGGPRMAGAGLQCWHDADELAVMGLFEVLRHLPRLLRLRRSLLQRILTEKPDLLIGIDAPDFNLGLERKARQAGIRTAHYVSPTVWAWREGRVHTVAAAADLVLCLFPFEPAFYARHGVTAHYAGHPLADEIPDFSDPIEARAGLDIPAHGPVVALLPGSRMGEVSRLAGPLIEAARLLAVRNSTIRFVAPMANARVRACFEQALAAAGSVQVDLVDGRAREVMAAADVVACASGTAALEAMLVNRPMVVVYRLSTLTYATAKTFRLFRNRYFSLPNILADEPLVPELLQHDATPERIAQNVQAWLDEPERGRSVQARFTELHRVLRRDAARAAAKGIRNLLGGGVQ